MTSMLLCRVAITWLADYKQVYPIMATDWIEDCKINGSNHLTPIYTSFSRYCICINKSFITCIHQSEYSNNKKKKKEISRLHTVKFTNSVLSKTWQWQCLWSLIKRHNGNTVSWTYNFKSLPSAVHLWFSEEQERYVCLPFLCTKD